MKGILHRTQQGFYMLFDENKQWMGVNGDCDDKKLKLSKENCDEIFGVVDVDRFSHEHCDRLYHKGDINWERYRIHFKEGFNKAMELQKDKLFTVDDMRKVFNRGYDLPEYLEKDIMNEIFDDYIQSLQQPTEIEVEIVTHVDLAATPVDSRHPDAYLGTNTGIPFLDEKGCLILKRF